MGKHRTCLIIISLVMGCFIFSCGYRFTGEGEFPGGASRLFVTVLENRTVDTGFEVPLTNNLIYEITRSKPGAYASDPAQADAVLSGVIQSTRTTTVSRLSSQVSLRRRVTIYVDLKLTDLEGKVVWKVRRLSAKQEYDVLESQAATERNREEALASAARKFAEKVFLRLTEEF